MQLNPIALAIPGFFLLIGAELLVARLMGRRVYRFADAVTDLGCGISNQVMAIFASGITLAAYTAVWDAAALWRPDATDPWAWLVAFVGVDFLYYWWHRASHRVNALWAAHVVHHQSEDYNLAVALRQALFTTWTILPFYLPLAILGVPPFVYATMVALSTLYQFWIHTELIGRLGPLEWVLNTPSHHRVHHAVNPRYIDRNHAAVLIVWDRLFGTFAQEREECVYGTVKPLGSFNPLWANLERPLALFRDSLAATRWSDKLALWVRGPEWVPEGVVAGPPIREITRAEQHKYDVPGQPLIHAWVVLNFVGVAALVFSLLMWEAAFPRPVFLAGCALCLWTVLDFGGLFEGKAWAWPSEAGRLLALGGTLAWWLG